MNDQILYWVWLSSRTRLGAKGLRELLETFGQPMALFDAEEEALKRAGVAPGLCAALLDKNLSPARTTLQTCDRLGITVLTPDRADYPAVLGRTADAPSVLYCRGTLPNWDHQPWIGLVGSREADARGLDLAHRFGAEIAACGGVVVTGMAKGIDAAAAQGALGQDRPVVGVLGCGVDIVYPRENAALFQLVAKEGCLLSEYPPGTAPNARHFPARNRIISALSDAVVVIQAAAGSGALITARWAAEQGRDLFSVPGPAGEPLSRGCNQLLREGAMLAESGLDVMREYVYRYPGAVKMQNAECKMQNKGSGGMSGSGAHRCATEQAPPEEAGRERPLPEDLTPIQKQIAEALRDGALQLDALIARTGLSAGQVLPQLTLLQIKGILSQAPGKIYQLRGTQ